MEMWQASNYELGKYDFEFKSSFVTFKYAVSLITFF
jgi:hypothetical protein